MKYVRSGLIKNIKDISQKHLNKNLKIKLLILYILYYIQILRHLSILKILSDSKFLNF